MPSTFFGLEISRRGIQAHRASLDVTAHNITNASTEGYSRQEAVHVSSDPYPAPSFNSGTAPGQLGSGVDVAQIRRIRNEFLDDQARNCASGKGYWEGRLEVSQQVELIFPEPDGRGLQDVMINFFNDWHELNNTPQDTGIKAAVRESGYELANQFRHMYSQLNEVLNSVAEIDGTTGEVTGGRIKDQVDRVNEIIAEIRELNESVARVLAEGRQPNDLLDKRDLLLDELAKYAPVEVEVQSNGMVNLSIYGLKVLFGGDIQRTLTAVLNADGGIELRAGGGSARLADFNNGSLAGLEDARRNILNHIETLNELARVLAEKVNYTHTHDDNGNELAGSSPFFKITDPSNPAASIRVHSDIVADVSKINGDRALAVARLRSTQFDELGGVTFEAKYGEMVALVGANTRSSSERLANQEAVKQQIEELRESAAGVSLDEELARMLQFQYGFQASARVVAAIDDMLDRIINRLF